MKKYYAFTLIELLIVISIMIITSISCVFYFSDFVENQGLKQRLFIISDDLNSLDEEIFYYNIYDYELTLDTTGNKNLWYIVYKNLFDLIKISKMNLDFDTWIWTWFLENGIASDLWKYKIFKKEKLFLEESWSWNKEYIFDSLHNSKITWTLTWIVLNDLIINYFTEKNFSQKEWDFVKLVSINTKKDKTWTWYTNLTIRNIWGNKVFKKNGVEINTEKIFLFFEIAWKQDFIKIIR